MVLLILQSFFSIASAATKDIYLTNVTTSTTTAGYPLRGAANGDQAGTVVRGGGDFNGDGFADILVTAPLNDESGADAGAAYVVFGHAGDSGITSLSASSFVSGPSVGMKLYGTAPGHNFGYSAANLGDTNGDGLSDFVISSPKATVAGNANAGIVYVVLGKRCNVTCSTFSVANMVSGGVTGFRIFGTGANAYTGISVASAGDFNKDGKMDILVGANQYTRTSVAVGAAFLILGSASTVDIDLASFTSSSTTGLRVFGAVSADSITSVGSTVAGVGDINGDGFADFAVAAPLATVYSRTNCGMVVVIFGHGAMTGFDDIVIPAMALSFSLGIRLIGASLDRFGTSLTSLGRYDNADSFADFAVGYNSYGSGSAVVIYGDGNPQDTDVTNFFPDTRATLIRGSTGMDALGSALASADLNGDGYMDFVISAMGATANGVAGAGVVYVIYGGKARVTSLDLSAFVWSATNGFRIYGAASSSFTGCSVSAAGDVNADGTQDLVVGASGMSSSAGVAYVLYTPSTNPSRAPTARPSASPSSAPSSFLTDFSLTSFTSSDYGYSLYGADTNNFAGFAVSGGGDVNGDGIADVIVGAKGASESVYNSGAVYVSFGHTGSFTQVDLNGAVFTSLSTGFKVMGMTDGDALGTSVKYLGDVNGDKIGDFIIGAPNQLVSGNTYAGIAYVIYGTANPINIQVAQWVTGTTGFRILGGNQGDYVGTSVSGASDFNNDGLRDILVGGPGFDYNGATNCGAAYVIFGKNGTSRADVNLNMFISDPSYGLRIFGSTTGANIITGVGTVVSNAGDFNGDGFEDILLGAPASSYNGNNACGVVAVVFGRKTNLLDIYLTTMVSSATQGFLVIGGVASSYFGMSVSTAGYFDKDNYKDVIIGAVPVAPSVGYALVLYGHGGTQANVDLANMITSATGFYITGVNAGDRTGGVVSNAGDLNGDGIGDVLVSAADDGTRFTGAGTTYVIYGRAIRPTSISLSSFVSSTQTGYRVLGGAVGDRSGFALSPAGDVNKDGLADFVVGAYNADPVNRANAGQTYVLFGVRDPNAPTMAPSTFKPSASPIATPTTSPSAGPSAAPLVTPTATPTLAPVVTPTVTPSASPTATPIPTPTAQPSVQPSYTVTAVPTVPPSMSPTATPTVAVLGSFDLTSLGGNQTAGYRVLGSLAADHLGTTVSNGGDLNGDGLQDFVVTAPTAMQDSLPGCGVAYVVFSKRVTVVGTMSLPAVDPAVLVAGPRDVDLNTLQANALSGLYISGPTTNSVLGAKGVILLDFDADGRKDVVLTYTKPSGVQSAVVVLNRFSANGYANIALSTYTGNLYFITNNDLSRQVESIANGGDINGDGAEDIVIGNPSAGITNRALCGLVYVVFGKPQFNTFSSLLLSNFFSGGNGFVIMGAMSGDGLGRSVAGVRDVNGDGFLDVMVGATVPAVYVVLGKSNATVYADIDLSGAYSGVKIAGSGSDLGKYVSAAGDFNGDGLKDVLFSVPGGNGASPSSAYVLLGDATLQTSGVPRVYNLTTMDFRMVGQQIAGSPGLGLGGGISAAGDVNHDGFDDILVSIPSSASATAYLLYGRSSSPPRTSIYYSSIPVRGGFTMRGTASASDSAGYAMSRLGDVNGDAIDDFLVSANSANVLGRSAAGVTYVVYGQAVSKSTQVPSAQPSVTPTRPPSASPSMPLTLQPSAMSPSVAPSRSVAADIDLSAMQRGVDGLLFTGAVNQDQLGSTAAEIGDFNGDGYADFAGCGYLSNAKNLADNGACYVIFGHNSSARFPVSDLKNFTTSPNNGFLVYGGFASDRVGRGVAGVGDMNGDGLPDLAFTVMRPATTLAASIYVMFGRRGGITADVNATTVVTSPTSGFQIKSAGLSMPTSYSLMPGRAGDVNGDGVDDLLAAIAVANINGRTNSGVLYVIFGSRNGLSDLYLSTLTAGTRGYKIFGDAGTTSGYTFSTAGDVDRDGLADIVLTAKIPSSIYQGFVIYGQRNTTPVADIDLSTFVTGSVGYRISFTGLGVSSSPLVSNVGDFNGDKIDDFGLGFPTISGSSRTQNGLTFVVLGQTTRPTADVTLNALGAGAVVRIIGEFSGDQAGGTINRAGDMNGDGIEDLLIGARNAAYNNRATSGTAFVVFGGLKFTSMASMDLSGFQSGTDGYRLYGATGNTIGLPIGRAGDVNGDGLPDLYFGSYAISTYSRSANGGIYIAYGKQSMQVTHKPTSAPTFAPTAPSAVPTVTPTTSPSAVPSRSTAADLDLLNFRTGTDGLQYVGARSMDNIATTASAIGDFNGDGYGDFALASYTVDALGVLNTGAMYVLFGQSSGVGYPVYDLKNFTTAPTVGFLVYGDGANTRLGKVVSAAGDLNGDGLADIAMHVLYPSAELRGTVFVMYGSRNPVSSAMNISSFVTGPSTGFRVFSSGAVTTVDAIILIARGRDVNGDGLDDLVVSMPNSQVSGLSNQGAVFVIFGSRGTPADIYLQSFTASTRGFRVVGSAINSVAGGGLCLSDVDHDGLADIVLTQRITGKASYDFIVIYGRRNTTASTDIYLSTFVTGPLGYRLSTQTAFGSPSSPFVSYVGDFNGDHIDDFALGYTGYSFIPLGRSNAGIAFVVFGQSARPTANLTLSTMASSAQNRAVQFVGEMGNTMGNVAEAGDLNGDGVDDLLIGARGASYFADRTTAGALFVIFGGSKFNQISFVDLANLNSGVDGFRVVGPYAGNNFGATPGRAGDLNGDGLQDFYASGTTMSSNGRIQNGALYIIYGRQALQVSKAPSVMPSYQPSAVPSMAPTRSTGADINLSSFQSGVDGMLYAGASANDNMGTAANAIGDFNGDGRPDFAMSSANVAVEGVINYGAVYILFGQVSGSSLPVTDLRNFTTVPGISLAIYGGFSLDLLGRAVVGAGDLNGDGVGDLATVVTYVPQDKRGTVFVMYGSRIPISTAWNITNFVTSASTGYRIISTGVTTASSAPIRIPPSGDINGDGLMDLVIGMPYTTLESRASGGAVFVIFGSRAAPSDIYLSGLSNTPKGFRILGPISSSNTGYMVCVSDVDHDGIADVVTSAKFTSSSGDYDTIVIYGRRNTTTSTDVDLFNFATGPLGFKILSSGVIPTNTLYTLSQLGDFNGDRVDDIALGFSRYSYAERGYTGAVFVVFGGTTRPTADVALNSLGRGSMVTIAGEFGGDYLGALGESGDLNGDGVRDLIVSARSASPNGLGSAGTTYVVYGGSKFNQIAVLDLLALNSGVDGFRINGAEASEALGYASGRVGDINGDGLQDLFTTSTALATYGRAFSGGVYVIYGRQSLQVSKPSYQPTALPTIVPTIMPTIMPTIIPTFAPSRGDSAVDASTIPSLPNLGYQIVGGNSQNYAGYAISARIDLNGDGKLDVVIGAGAMSYKGRANCGVVYLLFGTKTNGVFTDLRNVTSAQGVVIFGSAPNALAGKTLVGAAGDVNHDGIDDLLIGSVVIKSGRGFHILFGRTVWTAEVDLASLPLTSGFAVISIDAATLDFGNTAARAGDVNADGVEDLIFGAPSASPFGRATAGMAVVVFGRRNSAAWRDVYVHNFTTAVEGFRIYGVNASDQLGYAVNGAGDVNGDGIADIVAGAMFAIPKNRLNAGAAYVLFGHKNTSAFVDVDLSYQQSGWLLQGAVSSKFGISVSSTGDLNGDGVSDIVISTSTGTVYALYGAKTAANSLRVLDMSNFVAGPGLGFRIYSPTIPQQFGRALSKVGDINGDGFDDILLSGKLTRWFVVYGHSAAQPVVDIMCETFVSGPLGFEIYGLPNVFGSSRGVGDVNGDGIGDIALSWMGASTGDRSSNGLTYILYGRAINQYATSAPSNVPTALPSLAAPSAAPSLLTQYHTAQNLSTFVPGPRGMRLYGATAGDLMGITITALGDANKDGYPDFAVSAPMYTYTNRTNCGVIYVIFTRPGVIEIDLLTFVSGPTTGFRVFGASKLDKIGYSSLAAGDFNRDGGVDLLISGRYAANVNGAYFISSAAYTSTNYADIDLASFVSGTAGFKFIGITSIYYLGQSVALGDVNNDGIDDILITAPYASTSADMIRNGALYVLFGKLQSSWSDVPVTTTSLFNGVDGFRVMGAVASGVGAYSARLIPDINGDGYADLVVGSFRSSYVSNAYVVFGRAYQSHYADVDLRNFTNGFSVVGNVGDGCGYDAASGGDFNGDGVQDLLVSCPFTTNTARNVQFVGAAYVIFGKPQFSAFASVINVANITSGTQGFRILGATQYQYFSKGIAACDLNRDGYADVVVGGGWNAAPGEAIVIYGYAAASYPAIDTFNYVSGVAGFKIVGYSTLDYTGVMIRPLGDMNQDGTADVAISSYLASTRGRASAGIVTILFGISTNPTALPTVRPSAAPSAVPTITKAPSAGPSIAPLVSPSFVPSVVPTAEPSLVPTLVPSTLAPTTTAVPTDTASPSAAPSVAPGDVLLPLATSGARGRTFLTQEGSAALGYAVSGAGDVNNDGISDIIIGAPLATANGAKNGVAYVIYGNHSSSSFDELDLSTFVTGPGGFKIIGYFTDVAGQASFGASVSAAGDVNNDGIDDVAVGAVSFGGVARPFAGAVFVVFGATNIVDDVIVQTMANSQGFPILGADIGGRLGSSISLAGDMNGDGLGDLVIGAPLASLNGQTSNGVAYVVFTQQVNGVFVDIDLGSFNVGADGSMVVGVASGDNLGMSVSGGLDVNFDGQNDVVIGAPFSSGTGVVYVLFGTGTGAMYNDPTSYASSMVGYIVIPTVAGAGFGYSVSLVDDVNGDSSADILVGAPLTEPGSVYVVYGAVTATVNVLDVSVSPGMNSALAFHIAGDGASGQFGMTVSSAGDVNDDRLNDFVVTAPAKAAYGKTAVGAVYVFHGTTQAGFGGLSAASLTPTQGFRVLGADAEDAIGQSVSAAGDFNGDGVSDVVIGSPHVRGDSGEVVVVYGDSVVPTVRPSHAPHRSPTVRPSESSSVKPTLLPTVFDAPSVLPSIQPSLAPVVQPTQALTSTTQPVADPTAVPTLSPSVASNAQPTVLNAPSVLPTPSPSAAPSGEPSFSPTVDPSQAPSFTPTAAPSCQPTVVDAPSVIPTESPSAIPSLTPSMQPTLEDAPSFVPTVSPSLLPSWMPSRSPTHKPSARPTRTPSVKPSALPTVLVTSPNAAALNVTPIFAMTSKTSLTVQLTLSSNAALTVYCAARLPSKGALLSASDITSDGHFTAASGYTAVVVVPGLLPMTTYNVMCVGVTAQGVATSLQRAQKVALASTTDCCKSLYVKLLRSSVTPSDYIASAVSVSFDAAPTSSLTVAFSFAAINASVSDASFTPSVTYPSTLTLRNTSTASSVALSAGSSGTQALRVTLSGASAGEYNVVYQTATTLTVLAGSDQPDVPVAQSARFSNDGSSVVVSFDSQTNKAGYTNVFKCSTLLSFVGSSSATCQWTDASTIAIYPQFVVGASILVVGSTVKVKASHIKASCVSATATVCATWDTVSVTSLIVGAPLSAVLPVVSITAPSQISDCNSLTIDLTNTVGSAGRSWVSPTFTVTASVTAASTATTAIQAFLTKNYTISPPTAIPAKYMLSGATYTIQVKLCNFLGACDSEVATVAVRASDSIVPIVSIPGPAQRSVYRSAVLALSSSAYTQSCSGGVSYSNMDVSWSIASPSGASTTGILSSSVNPAAYKLNAYSLKVGSQYTVILTGKSSISGVSSSSSVLISVLQGSLVAKLAGGSTRSIRAGDGAVFDASSSYDEDVQTKTGLAAGLTFQWSCVQSAPTFSAVCPLTLPVHLNTMAITVNATALSLNKTSTVSVVVSDATRSSTAQVTITVTTARQPVLTLTSPLASLSNINTAKSLVLLGSVQLYTSCAAQWTVDDETLPLSSLSTTPVVATLQPSTRTVAFNLALSPNTLPGRATLVFTLNCGGAQNSLTVTTNGAPLPGTFDVTPSAGVELSTVFQFVATQWTDSDLPLTYQFGFQSVTSVSNLVIVSKSELSFSTSTLPAGTQDSVNTIQCNLQVYDNLAATANTTDTVTVTSLTKAQQHDSLLSLVQSNTGTVDSVKNIISVVSATLNSVNCSSAPNCTLLNRASCLRTSNACSACVYGYIGDIGDRNTLCIPASATYDSCASQSDCLPWQLCEVVTGVCTAPQKTCSNGCNDRGSCIYVNKASGDMVSSCALDNLNCDAVCSCEGDFSGVSCEMNVGDLHTRRQLRSSLIDGLFNLTDLEDPSEQSVSGWSASLYSLSLSPYELSVNDAKQVLRIANRTVTHAAGLNLDSGTDIVGLLQATDAVFSVQKYNYIPNDFNELNATRNYLNNTAVGIIDVVSAFAGLLSKTQVLGQNSSTYFYDNFRVSSQLAPFSGEATNLSISGPQTDFERLTHTAVPSVRLSPNTVSTSTASVAVSVISVYPSAYTPDTSAFVSSPLYLQITPDSGEAAAEVVSTMEFTFPFSESNPAFVESPTNFTFFCFNVHQNYTFTCPDTGHVLSHNCSTGRGEYVKFCPRRAPTCARLDIATANISAVNSCHVVSFDADAVTCACTVNRSSTRTTGRRTLYTVEQALLDQTGVSSMLATSVVILNEFVDTFNAAPDLTNPEDVIIVILMFATLWGAGVLLLSVCFWRDHVALRKKVRMLSRQVVGVVTSLEGGTSIDDAKVRLLNYIENIIPSVYAGGKTNFHRMVGELRSHHRYLTLFTLGDGQISNLSKVLIIVQVLTVETMQMFLLAVMYDLQEPDDDHSCPTFTNEGDCTARKSIFDDSQSYCQWKYNPSTMETACSFHNIQFTAKIFIFILILTSVFTAVVNTPLDYLFKICAAPLIEDAMDQQVANTEANGAKRRFSIANGLRRVSAMTGQVAAGARRRSSAVLVNTQQFVKERFWYSGIVDSVNGSERVIADRDIPEDVQHMHKSAVQSLPSITKHSDYLQEKRRNLSLELKQKADFRRSRGESMKMDTPQTDFLDDINTPQEITNSPVSPLSTAIAEAGESMSGTMKRLTDEIICQRLLLPLHSYHAEIYDAQWGLVAREKSDDFVLTDEAHAAIEEDVHAAETEARELNEKLPLYTLHHGGLAILNMFLLDLLGKRTIAAKIFRNKFEEDFEETRAVSRPFKAFAITVLVGCNAFFIYYSLLKALQKGQSWQYQYLQGCIAQMAVEIFLNETLECLWLNYVVPDLARKEVNRVTMILNHVVDQITSKVDTFKSNSVLFLDAPSYLFASTKVAKAHPKLIESIVVMNFHSHLPGELSRTWPHYKRYAAEKLQDEMLVDADAALVGSSGYKITNSFLFRAILAVGVYVTLSMQLLGSLSFNLQRIVIRVIQPLLLSGLTLMWLFASSSTPALIITFSCTGAFVLAFLWRQRYLHLEEVRRNSIVAPSLEDDSIEGDAEDADDEMGPGSMLHLAQGSVVSKSNAHSSSRSDSELSHHRSRHGHSHSHGYGNSSSDSEAPGGKRKLTEKIRHSLLAVLAGSASSDSEDWLSSETSASSGAPSIDLSKSSSKDDSQKVSSDHETAGLALYRQLKAEQVAKETATPSQRHSRKVKLSIKQNIPSSSAMQPLIAARNSEDDAEDSGSSSGFEFDINDLYEDMESTEIGDLESGTRSKAVSPKRAPKHSPNHSPKHSPKNAHAMQAQQRKSGQATTSSLPPVRISGVAPILPAVSSPVAATAWAPDSTVASSKTTTVVPPPRHSLHHHAAAVAQSLPSEDLLSEDEDEAHSAALHASEEHAEEGEEEVDGNGDVEGASSLFDDLGLGDSHSLHSHGAYEDSDGDSAFSVDILPPSYTTSPATPVQRKGKGQNQNQQGGRSNK